MYRMGKITLQRASVSLEAGVHYWVGCIQMPAQAPLVGDLANSFVTKETALRPIYSGSGETCSEPTFGKIDFLELNG